jgi:hypothetical protein
MATGGQKGSTVGGAPRPALSGKANIGHFGYANDSTWEHASLKGIGAFKHTSKPGSMIEGYSAGLTKEGAALRGLTHPGQEFYDESGALRRWDDTAPSFTNGHAVSPRYVDVYSPHYSESHSSVSAAQIADNEQTMAVAGIGSAGKRGPIVEGETPRPALGKGQGSSGSDAVQEHQGSGGQATSPVEQQQAPLLLRKPSPRQRRRSAKQTSQTPIIAQRLRRKTRSPNKRSNRPKIRRGRYHRGLNRAINRTKIR